MYELVSVGLGAEQAHMMPPSALQGWWLSILVSKAWDEKCFRLEIFLYLQHSYLHDETS